jgi:hypothetical protein
VERDASVLTYEQLLASDIEMGLREGSMYYAGNSAVHKTLHRIAQKLDELGIDYAVAGGMCLYRHGFQRFTQDVDVIVTREGLAQIHEQLEGRGYVKPFAASKNLRDTDTGVRIDFIISGQYPGEGKPGPIAFPVPSTVSKAIDGVRYVDLVPFIELKLASGQASHRAQDLHDVQQLITARSLSKELAEQLHPSLRESYVRKWNDAQKAATDEY